MTVSRGNFAVNRPVYEQAVAHFEVRMGLTNESLWSLRGREVAIANAGYETTGWSLDHPGWGALTFRRPPLAAGDPIKGFSDGIPQFEVHQLSGTIPAENYDYFPADGEGRTYHDLTPTNSGGEYRDDAVDIAFDPGEGYYLTDLEDGEWLTYTVNVSATGNYGLLARYAAVSGSGTIQFAFGGSDMTGEIALPATGGMSSWATHAVAGNVFLSAGVQTLRVSIGGASNAFNLKSVTLSPMLGYSLSGNQIQLSWPADQTGWRLESQTNSLAAGISSTWFDVPGSEATNVWSSPVNSVNGSVFYRLVSP